MRSLSPLRPSVSRGVPGLVAIAAVVAVAGCSGGADDAVPGPPRLTPDPQHEVAAEMIDSRPAPQERLNACELLDLTTAQVIELTGSAMPEVEPTGSGDLGLICTYGGPGSPERAESGAGSDTDTDTDTDAGAGANDTDTDTDNDDDDDDPTSAATASTVTSTTVTTSTDATPTSTGTASTTDAATSGATAGGTDTEGEAGTDGNTDGGGDVVAIWDMDSDLVPDTFAAGVVEPQGGAEAALAGQPAMLGVRYACSDVRGAQASSVEGAPPAAPGAPAPTLPALATAYIDCIATPTGGGVEVHTIFVVDDRLWHITSLQPETPRTPEAETLALAGLHRVAEHVLD